MITPDFYMPKWTEFSVEIDEIKLPFRAMLLSIYG